MKRWLVVLLSFSINGWAEAPLSDAQIVHIFLTANAVQVEAAKLMSSLSSNSHILGYAEVEENSHGLAIENVNSLIYKLELNQEDNEVSQKIRRDSGAALSQLKGAKGADLSRLYLAQTITFHEKFLQVLDSTLIPKVTHPELKDIMERMRTEASAHVVRAKEIQLNQPTL